MPFIILTQTTTLASSSEERTLHSTRWLQHIFYHTNIVGILAESEDPNDYWYRLKKRESETSETQLSTFCRQLKLKSSDEKEYETDCADTEGIFRIIHSISYQPAFNPIL